MPSTLLGKILLLCDQLFELLLFLQGGPKKLDHFLMLITLRWLVVERRVICQKFTKFV